MSAETNRALAAKFFDFAAVRDDGFDADIIRHGMFRAHAGHDAAIGRRVGAAGINVQIIRHAGNGIDFPTKQFAVK